jgi:hypothetical protein
MLHNAPLVVNRGSRIVGRLADAATAKAIATRDGAQLASNTQTKYKARNSPVTGKMKERRRWRSCWNSGLAWTAAQSGALVSGCDSVELMAPPALGPRRDTARRALRHMVVASMSDRGFGPFGSSTIAVRAAPAQGRPARRLGTNGPLSRAARHSMADCASRNAARRPHAGSLRLLGDRTGGVPMSDPLFDLDDVLSGAQRLDSRCPATSRCRGRWRRSGRSCAIRWPPTKWYAKPTTLGTRPSSRRCCCRACRSWHDSVSRAVTSSASSPPTRTAA